MVKEHKTDFMAELLHSKTLEQRTLEGYHLPGKHLNPFEVAPQRRPDGYTFCDKCDQNHLPYKELSTMHKLVFIKQVELFQDIQRSWDESHH